MQKREKNPSFTTPVMTLNWPKLDKPDYGTKEYPKPEGQYATKARGQINSPEVKAFLAQLAPVYRAAIEEAQQAFANLKVETRKKLGKVTENPLYSTVYDQETEEPTGEIEFKFVLKASGVRKDGTKWNTKPDIYDALGVKIVKVPEIWGGTTARVNFEVSPYFIPGSGAAGLSLKLRAVQIVELVSGGARSASAFGFGAVEGGYAHTDTSTSTEEEHSPFTSDQTVDDDIDF
jgi:hypothetical protein